MSAGFSRVRKHGGKREDQQERKSASKMEDTVSTLSMEVTPHHFAASSLLEASQLGDYIIGSNVRAASIFLMTIRGILCLYLRPRLYS